LISIAHLFNFVKYENFKEFYNKGYDTLRPYLVAF
jgi:hypothetical protein